MPSLVIRYSAEEQLPSLNYRSIIVEQDGELMAQWDQVALHPSLAGISMPLSKFYEVLYGDSRIESS